MKTLSRILLLAVCFSALQAQAAVDFDIDDVVAVQRDGSKTESVSKFCQFKASLVHANNVDVLKIENSNCSLLSIKELPGNKMFEQADGTYSYTLENPEKYLPIFIVSRKDRGAEIRFMPKKPALAKSITIADGQVKNLDMCGAKGTAFLFNNTLTLENADECVELQRIAGDENDSAIIPFRRFISVVAFPENVILLRDANGDVKVRITIVE